MGVFKYWPNRITAIRFVGAMVLFALFAFALDCTPEELPDNRVWVHMAFWLFVVIAATDFLDGYLARRDGHVTAFGRIADPFTDKVLILGTMIFLTSSPWSRDLLPPWMVVVILSRELLVTGLRGYVESRGGEFPADGWGKLKMILQCIAVGCLLWSHAWDWPDVWSQIWFGVTVAFIWATLLSTVASGVGYVQKTIRILADLEA